MKRSIVLRYFFIVTFNTFLYENVNKIYFNVPPDTKHVNFISPPSSYGPATVDTVFPCSSMMFGLCGGTKKEKKRTTTLQINLLRVYYCEMFRKKHFSIRNIQIHRRLRFNTDLFVYYMLKDEQPKGSNSSFVSSFSKEPKADGIATRKYCRSRNGNGSIL